MEGSGANQFTFCTFMLWLVLEKIKLARIALAKRRACVMDISVGGENVIVEPREPREPYLV